MDTNITPHTAAAMSDTLDRIAAVGEDPQAVGDEQLTYVIDLVRLAQTAGGLSPSLRDRTITLVRGIPGLDWRAAGLAEIVPLTEGTQQDELIDELLTLLRTLDGDELESPLTYISTCDLPLAVYPTLHTIAQHIPETERRDDMLSLLFDARLRKLAAALGEFGYVADIDDKGGLSITEGAAIFPLAAHDAEQLLAATQREGDLIWVAAHASWDGENWNYTFPSATSEEG